MSFITDGVSHVPEDRNAQGLVGDMSIAENLVLKETDSPKFSQGKGLRLNKRAIHDYAEEMVQKYDVRCTSVGQTVRSLSGGNQQKVILARELESQPVPAGDGASRPAAWISARPALFTSR